MAAVRESESFRVGKMVLSPNPLPPGVMIMGHGLEVELLFINLLKNAHEALTNKEDKAAAQVSITLNLSEKEVSVTVADNGPAISEEDFAKLKSVSESVKPEGLGLGLAIVRNIVDEHGARFVVNRPPERVEAEFAKGENLWKCATLEELCEKSGVKLDGLKKQLAVWNKAVETKNDLQFGRSDQQYQLKDGPWYLIRMFPWNNLSSGGVRVTEHFEVLGWDLKPIAGFYAAGEIVAGVHGAFYCGGNACGFAHTSGFMAGKYVTGYKEA